MTILPENNLGISSDKILIKLGATAALGQGSLHIIVPAIGAIAEEFGVSFGIAQLVVTSAMIAMAISTILSGILADKFGRKPIFISGLILFILGGLVAARANSETMVIVGRSIQGVGGITGLVLGRAIMRDMFDSTTATRGISFLMIGQITGPAVAPLIGSLILIYASWREIFLFTAVLGCGLFVWALNLPETKRKQQKNSLPFRAAVIELLSRRKFWAAIFVSSLTVAMFFSLIVCGSWFVTEYKNLSPLYYAIFMASFTFNFLIGNLVNSKMLLRHSPEIIIKFGFIGTLISVILLTLLVELNFNFALYLIPCGIFAFSNGLIISNSISLAVNTEPRAAGTASGISTFMQMTLSAITMQAVGSSLPYFGLHSLIVLLIFLTAFLAFFVLLLNKDVLSVQA